MAKSPKKETLPAELANAFKADAGMGHETLTISDMQIPFLRIIQALSPQLKKSDPAFIEGASQGDIFNTVTNKVWQADKGITVVPIHYVMKLLEFVPRQSGGGFVGELYHNSPEVQQAVRDKESGMELLPNGNELVRTAQHYVKIVHEDGSLESAIVDMKKTQRKVSKVWNSLAKLRKSNGVELPIFASTYHLTSVEDGNDKGSWYSWSVEVGDLVPSIEVYNECKELHISLRKGEMQIPVAPSDLMLDDQSSNEVPF
tara:strand:+ start:317 stop:1090 length:774 start_codon:yes stop_codon:yes gene_type:complete